jgi:predicted metal-dependent hydrolase
LEKRDIIKYTLIRSKRKTLELRLDAEGNAIVRAPLRFAKYRIDEFVAEKSGWIAKNRRKIAEQMENFSGFNPGEIARLKSEAAENFRERVNFFSALMSVTPAKVKISDARTRWGSCSGKNSVNLNWRLMLCPAEIRDYVIIHELAHISHKNHGAKFWARVAEFSPNYKICREWLKVNGGGLMRVEN